MARRWAEPRRAARALLVAFVCLATARAQTPATNFVTPDGSRFVLIAEPAIAQVHWAIASPDDPAFEPAGFEGLAWTTAQLSLYGTWTTGSVDAGRERTALDQLDLAWQQVLRAPRPGEPVLDVQRCDEAARALADLTAFRRVLAAAPVHRPEILSRGAAAVLVLTTLPTAVGEVGRLLVERRDQQPLRELPRGWLETFGERSRRHMLDVRRSLHGELLALAMPDQPLARTAEPPNASAPTREQALAVWAATQHPQRTVHVLLGDLDVAATQRALEQIFVNTTLPQPAAAPPPAARPLAGSRRSTVGGVPVPTVALAWLLPADLDPFVLATAVRWLADGQDSVLAQELLRQERPGVTVRGQAPWPPALGGRSLFVIEASDGKGAGGLGGLADSLLTLCRQALATAPDAASVQRATRALQHDWRQANAEPRLLAAELAAAALTWPGRPPTTEWPDDVTPAAVRDVLTRILAGHPVIVEGTP